MNTKELVRKARQAVSGAAYNPYKLFLVHTSVSVGVTLLAALIQYLLAGQIENADGLGGMATVSAMQTAQILLSQGISLLLPLWEVGALFAAIRIFRGESVDISCLAEGFRKFWVLLRTMILEMVLYLVVAFVSMYAVSFLYTLTPFSIGLNQTVAQWTESITTEEQLIELAQNPEFTEAILQQMVPMLVLSAVVAVGTCVFLSYMIRLMKYLVLDSNAGPLQALKLSIKLTAGHKRELFKLDLQFWWYYLVQFLLPLILYVPELSKLTGSQLPMEPDVAQWLCYGVYAVAQVALMSLIRPKAEVAFAGAYDALKENV